MPLIKVKILEGRPKEKIEDLIENLTDTVCSTLDSPKEAVRVIVNEVPKTHWGRAGKSIAKHENNSGKD